MDVGGYAVTVIKKIQKVNTATQDVFRSSMCRRWLPRPSKCRKRESLEERPFNLEDTAAGVLGGGPNQPDTVFYLAYGSNLSSEAFQGRRGIRPLSQLNVIVPELVMTFDLAGLPYVEPCFANIRYRKAALPSSPSNDHSEKSGLLSKEPKYHKNRWKKGLVGVVYEVTKSDYAHIIATEGGGASYQDVLVDCYELSPNGYGVPESPTSVPFKAHTLHCPVYPPGTKQPVKGGRFSRPDPAYAQPSARYLKLINDGADEHALPGEYREYLCQLRSYTITSQKQRLGAWTLGMIWLPFMTLVFGLYSRFADKKGKAPKWLAAVTGAIFRWMWASYDGIFYWIFGDGERTVEANEEVDGSARKPSLSYGAADEKGRYDSHLV